MKRYSLFLALIVCVAFAGSLFAQQDTGEIKGKVVDNEGAPIPGVSITASSPSLQGTRSAISDDQGNFRFPLLPIGQYELLFELPGFKTLRQKGYNVRVGFTVSIRVVMEVATIEEEVTVTAESPIIDKTNTDTSYRLSAEELAQAPVQGRTIQEVVAYTPGVTGVRQDTLDGEGSGLPSFRGEGEEGNNWLVDGLPTSGTRTNNPGITVNFDTWDEVQVVSDGFTPDFESALGGIINIVTKSGGNVFHGEAGALIRDHHLRAERQEQLSVVTEPETSFHNYYGNVGGPIIKDKLWFFVSDNFHRRADDTEAQSLQWLSFPPGSRRRTTNNAFGKLTFTPHERHTFALSGTLDKFLSQDGGTGLPERYYKDVYTDWNYRLNYKAILTSNTLLEAAAGQQKSDWSRKPLDENSGPAQYYFYDITQYTNNYEYSERINVEKRTDFSVRLTQYLDTGFLGNHELGLGMNYYYTYAEDASSWNGLDFDPFGGNNFENGVEIHWAEPGIPSVLYEYGPYGFYNETKGFGFFLRDKITLERVTLMLGVRSETQKCYNDNGEVIWTWGLGDFLSPRASMAIDLFNDGNNVLKLSFGIFSDTVTTRVLEFFNKSGGYQYRQYQWTGPNNPTDAQLQSPANWFFIAEQSPQQTPMDYDPDLKPNKTYKYLAEFDRRLGPNWALKIRGVYSQAKDLLEDIGVYDPVYVWTFFLTNFELKKRDYKAIEVELNGRILDKFMLNASYTWSEAKGTNPGQFELGPWQGGSGSGYYIGVFGDHVVIPDDNPYNIYDIYMEGLGGRGAGDEGWYGFLPYSVDHTVKVLGTYLAPYDFIVTLGFEYLSGYHWSKRGFQPLYGDFLTFPEGRGSRTTPGHAYVDLSIQKDFTFSPGFAVGLRLNVFNILNSQTATSYVRADTALFGEIFGRQEPRWLQFHVLFKF